MSTVTIKNIPEKLHQKLKRNASRNHRSLNSELIACLENSVGAASVRTELLLACAHGIRSKIGGQLTEERLCEFKSEFVVLAENLQVRLVTTE